MIYVQLKNNCLDELTTYLSQLGTNNYKLHYKEEPFYQNGSWSKGIICLLQSN